MVPVDKVGLLMEVNSKNGYVESVIGKCRYEFLNGEVFYSLLEAQVLLENWRQNYNQIRPHSPFGNQPPAPEAIQPKSEVRISH